MTTPPSQYPDWATTPSIDPISGQPNIVQPSGQLQAVGYSTGDVPNANNFNWLSNLTGLWIRYLDSSIAQNAAITTLSSDGSAAALLPNSGSACLIIAANDAGSFGLYIGYQANTGSPATLNSIGGGTILVTPSAGGIISANDPANPTSPMVLFAISAGS